MKLKYLGTAAAEGIPALFCRCELCRTALERGGRDIKTRSQAIVNSDLLIDFPCDTYMHVIREKIDLSACRWLLVTHAHEDHFYPADFGIYGDCYAHNMTSEKLEIYCNSRVKEMFDAVSREIAIPDSIKNNLLFTVVSAFEEFSLGDRYRVTPLKANHSPNENALFYLIREGEKQLLYAHDTGHFPEETTDYLEKNLVRPVDMLSLDATLGKNHCYDGHMGFYECFDMLDILKQRGIVDDNTVVVFNHFSHNGMLLHDEASELAAAHGALVSYDGMQVEL